jgi:hypothetical protein
MRALYGQATHEASTTEALERLNERSGGRLRKQPEPTVGCIGAGTNLTGLQALRWLGATSSYLFTAEACPIAGPAGDAFAAACGHSPRRFERAECDALQSPRWHSSLELITLRCAPYSLANASYPKGVEAALAELFAVICGLAARRPLFVVFETTAGVWKRPGLRMRVEAILRTASYEWEASRCSPLTQGGVCERDRIFYTGYLRT